jgi:8-oxo-dGTP pyrophosphatase MutT (NUDIX family)
MHTTKGNDMHARANKPLPRLGTSSDGRPMHYSAGAIIENERGEYFLMDRKYEPYGFAGMAGHIDAGEYPLQALIREALEEIGAKLHNIRLFFVEEVLWNFCWNDGVHRTGVHEWHLYSARVNSRDVKVNKHEAKGWGWFTKDEIRTGKYVREGVEHTLTLEPVWEHWFKLVGILPA